MLLVTRWAFWTAVSLKPRVLPHVDKLICRACSDRSPRFAGQSPSSHSFFGSARREPQEQLRTVLVNEPFAGSMAISSRGYSSQALKLAPVVQTKDTKKHKQLGDGEKTSSTIDEEGVATAEHEKRLPTRGNTRPARSRRKTGGAPVQYYTGASPVDFPEHKPPASSIMTVFVRDQKRRRRPQPGRKISVRLDSHMELLLPPEWLRDNCPCHKCIDPVTGQKTFSTAEVALYPKIDFMERTPNGGLRVVWDNGGFRRLPTPFQPYSEKHERFRLHESFYSWDFLSKLAQPPAYERYRQWPYEWMGSSFTPLEISYNDWMAGGSLFRRALLALDMTGLIFVKKTPQSETAVEDVVRQIGNVQETFWGRTWDVRVKPNPDSLASTSHYVPMHQHLQYMADPPRIGLLHCLENECSGGELLFSDGRTAARRLYRIEYKRLAAWPVRYVYDKNGHFYHYDRPVFCGDLENSGITHWNNVYDMSQTLHGRPDINQVRRWRLAWSPPFQDRAMAPVSSKCHAEDSDILSNRYLRYHRSCSEFQTVLEDPSAVVKRKLKSGDCVLWDNWRVVVGRHEIKPIAKGVLRRWLKGAYISHQVFDSKVRITLRDLEKKGLWQMRNMPNYRRLDGKAEATPKARYGELDNDEDNPEEDD